MDAQLESHRDVDAPRCIPASRSEILAVFRSCDRIDAGRRFRVERNGIALLLAYCLEAIQQRERILFDPLLQ
jgi:hypothetical protein